MPEIMNSIGIGATMMAVVAGMAGVAVLPAALRLLGPRVEFGAFGSPVVAPSGGRAFALPAAAALVALVLIVPLAGPVLSLGSGPPDAKLLPASSKARQDFEAVAKVMGPGWVSPFEVVVARNGAPVTTRAFLGKLAKFEKQTTQMTGVHSVVGPGALFTNANDLQGVPNGLNTAAATAKKSKKELKKLIAGLKLATDGVAQLRGGLGEAASGAGQLHGGTGQAYGGSSQLSSGLSQADAGAAQLKAGAAQAAAGSKELAAGLQLAGEGVAGGLPSVQKLIEAVNSNAKDVAALSAPAASTQNEIDAAAASLAAMTVGQSDPHYTAVVQGLQRAASSNAAMAGAITTAARDASLNAATIAVVKAQMEELQTGIGKLSAGANQLSTGLGKLSGGNSSLASGIAQLDAGGKQLQDGLRQLNDGAGQLAVGLSSGAGPSGELLAGMNTITGAVIKSRAAIPSTKDLEKLRKEAPGLFDSGYFVLAAIDGAPAASRDAAKFVVNVDDGGYAGRITVVPEKSANSESTRVMHDRLSKRVAAFAATHDAQAAVGGTGADLVSYRELGLERLPIVAIALVAVGFAVLMIITRSFATAGLAVLLNLITAGVTFGVLSLLFAGDDPLLGGPGFVDPVTMISILTIVLALSINYEVFAVERLRLVTGAGLAMVAVLVPFAFADVTLIREFAIGMAVAIVIDTVVVRPLLAALIRAREDRPRTHPRMHIRRLIPH
jgi:X-X-X-Leu-X-X-Gly heptad repeat protein